MMMMMMINNIKFFIWTSTWEFGTYRIYLKSYVNHYHEWIFSCITLFHNFCPINLLTYGNKHVSTSWAENYVDSDQLASIVMQI